MSTASRKVVLYAFGRKLKSEPMDWPQEQIGRDIYLLLDMEQPSHEYELNSSIKVYETTTKRARFEFSGGYSMNHSGEPAVYVLVGVES